VDRDLAPAVLDQDRVRASAQAVQVPPVLHPTHRLESFCVPPRLQKIEEEYFILLDELLEAHGSLSKLLQPSSAYQPSDIIINKLKSLRNAGHDYITTSIKFEIEMEEMRRLGPDLADVGIEDANLKANALREIALDLIKAGDKNLALDVLKQAVEAAQEVLYPWDKADALREIALALGMAGDKEQALVVFKQAVKAAKEIEIENEEFKASTLRKIIASLEAKNPPGP
jgi:tetratricopeptide (TPR) repeat protein